MLSKRLPLALSLAVVTAACGTRSALYVDPPEVDASRPDGGTDGGTDGGVDGGTDAGPPDAGGLMIACGRRDQYTSPRRLIELTGEASSPFGIAEQQWTMVGQPRTSMPEFRSARDGTATLTPDMEGDYELVFTAIDGTGAAATCEVTVHSVVGPPVALCPEESLRTVIGVPIDLFGDGFDDEMVVSYRWELLSAPPGATPMLTGDDMPVARLVSDTRGPHRLRLTVADPDMAMGSCEIEVLVTGPPMVTCPMDFSSPTRQPVDVTATATDDVGIVSETWELVSVPASSRTTASPTTGLRTRITPDRQGVYQLRFTAVDVEGLSASCTTRVTGTPTPPIVTCPEVLATPPLTPVDVVATAVDDGTIVSWRWQRVSGPAGTTATLVPATAAATVFTPDIAGIYELLVTATDNDGMTGTCTTRVEAGNVDGLRVEMIWDTTGTDIDLHLMNPEGTRWTSEDDCHYANCDTRSSGGVPVLDWYGPDDEDDPRLDIDDTDGMGPENINITRPEPGTYRIGVHNFSGGGPNRVTIAIYCGGDTTTPRQVFGPVPLRGRGGSDRGDFWRVADVTVTAAGCTIADLTLPDGSAWVVSPYSTTQNMR